MLEASVGIFLLCLDFPPWRRIDAAGLEDAGQNSSVHWQACGCPTCVEFRNIIHTPDLFTTSKQW